jgi:hypothetical protein
VCAVFCAFAIAGCAAHTTRGNAPAAASHTPTTQRAQRSAVVLPHATPRASTAARTAHIVLPAAATDPRPYILSANVSPAVVRSGTTVSAVVRTTPGVASVVAYAAGTSLPVPREGAGLFAGSTTLPELPAFVHGVFPVTFVARDRHGRTTQTAVSVRVP